MPSNAPITEGLQPLTPKAIKFAELVAKGHKPSHAYMQAYNVEGNTKKRSIQSAAARLTGDARVQRHIERLKEKDAQAAIQQAVGLRQWTLDALKAEASNQENPAAARVSALGLLARASRLIESGSQQNVNVNVANVTRPSDEIERELLDRLSRIGGASVIEGEILGEDDAQDRAESGAE